MKKKPSLLGGACIIASVCVGAGMLGLPSAGAGAWTLWSILAITLTMAVMTLSGWMLLEAFKNYELGVSFDTVTKDVLGKGVNHFNNLAVYFVGGILLYAYITSSGLILEGLFDVHSKIMAILFVLVFSGLVWHSTRAVDRISIVLILFMFFTFFFGVSGMLSNIETKLLFDRIGEETSYAPYAIAMLPVALTSFGYHHSVASMRNYYGEERRAKYAILGGTSIALIFYVLWMVSIYGNLARDAFAPIIAQGGEVDILLSTLGSAIASENVANAINAFSMAAILSSFIGVGLGLFDFLADFFGFEDTKQGRLKTWSVTFLPPLLCSLLFPFGFIIAIGYAGAAATVWTCIIPALLVLKLRKKAQEEVKQQDVSIAQNTFMAPGGSIAIIIVMVFGVLTAVFHFMAMLNLLPSFSG